MKTELKFHIAGLSEQQLVAYCEGIIDALDKLGVTWLYDETDPALQTYRVILVEEATDSAEDGGGVCPICAGPHYRHTCPKNETRLCKGDE